MFVDIETTTKQESLQNIADSYFDTETNKYNSLQVLLLVYFNIGLQIRDTPGLR